MTKTQLDAEINRKFYRKHGHKVPGISDVLIEQFTQTLERRGHIQIRGFGSWFLRYKLFKTHINPKTFISFIKKHCFRFRFKASPALNNRINKDLEEKEEHLAVLTDVLEPMVDTDEAINKAVENLKEGNGPQNAKK